ncbi:translation initiation factor IF-2-like isoform X2 [Meles meles]|uniref:translation initiation factor IF-2-like isoform X2 n=1 Tax=Meles meles TaxID=9662 RepID=UPI001E69D2D7|nr:translation initiation factor IF-2-like isoform X2 [Meles meles]XP_045840742.1 translation initiation factor IF-2-like isoform X2 [Meles meles]
MSRCVRLLVFLHGVLAFLAGVLGLSDESSDSSPGPRKSYYILQMLGPLCPAPRLSGHGPAPSHGATCDAASLPLCAASPTAEAGESRRQEGSPPAGSAASQRLGRDSSAETLGGRGGLRPASASLDGEPSSETPRPRPPHPGRAPRQTRGGLCTREPGEARRRVGQASASSRSPLGRSAAQRPPPRAPRHRGAQRGRVSGGGGPAGGSARPVRAAVRCAAPPARPPAPPETKFLQKECSQPQEGHAGPCSVTLSPFSRCGLKIKQRFWTVEDFL